MRRCQHLIVGIRPQSKTHARVAVRYRWTNRCKQEMPLPAKSQKRQTCQRGLGGTRLLRVIAVQRMVGTPGFEPGTSAPPERRANRAAPCPEELGSVYCETLQMWGSPAVEGSVSRTGIIVNGPAKVSATGSPKTHSIASLTPDGLGDMRCAQSTLCWENSGIGAGIAAEARFGLFVSERGGVSERLRSGALKVNMLLLQKMAACHCLYSCRQLYFKLQ